ncbi:Arc family DNA-binding protein [Oribacterium parvum]|uniref:Arc family DNA-binding protein n=1 Tax=Oribacterium parvum TaxID=1501329 RepID=UPI0028E18E85|nr:Arc family DNA-binding protein [Oribacterium parvum]
MSIQANPYPLRVDKKVMDKIKFIANDSGRSVNKEIEHQLKAAIRSYEAEHGEVPLPCTE